MNIETECKLIIEKPNPDTVRSMEDYTESRITQIYLKSENTTHRVRRREYSDGRVVYTENKKVRISRMSSTEYEREISEEEYTALAQNIEIGAAPLFKTRRTFTYEDKTVELDYYDQWEKTCVMEIELLCESETVEFPPFIKVLCDVTGKREYSNHSMAHAFPEEII